MKKFKLLISLVTILALVTLTFAGCGSNSADDEGSDSYKIKIAHTMSDKHSYNQAALKFKELIEDETDGRIEVEVYPTGQLGAEREAIEAVQAGTLEIVVTGTSAMSGFVPEWQIFDFAYLFQDFDEFWEVMRGDIGEKFNEEYSVAAGFRGLGIGCMGIRNVHSTKGPINTLSDMKGLKLRVMESNVHIATFKAMGASPVTMAFSELFTALEQGTVDAEEAVPSGAYTSKTYEICKYYSKTEHFWLPCNMFASEKWLQTLSEEDQDLIKKVGAQAMVYQWEFHEQDDAEKIQLMVDEGTIVNEVENKTPFIEAAHSVYKEILTKVPHGEETMDAMSELLGRNMYETF